MAPSKQKKIIAQLSPPKVVIIKARSCHVGEGYALVDGWMDVLLFPGLGWSVLRNSLPKVLNVRPKPFWQNIEKLNHS